MKTRITESDLKKLCRVINDLTGSPAESYINGRAQIGNYHISFAYGGVCLHRMHSEGGAVTTPLCCYHEPKRDLHNRMLAYIAGLESRP